MQRRRTDDDDRWRGGILRDGEIVRIPMMLRDADGLGWRDEMAATFAAAEAIERDARRANLDPARAQFLDARGLTAGYRPGFIIPRTPVADDPRVAIYRQHDQEEAERWKTPPAGAGSTEFAGPIEGAACMTDSKRPGRYVRGEDGGLVCRAITPTDSQPNADARERLYAMRDWEDANAWRGEEWMRQNRPAEFRR